MKRRVEPALSFLNDKYKPIEKKKIKTPISTNVALTKERLFSGRPRSLIALEVHENQGAFIRAINSIIDKENGSRIPQIPDIFLTRSSFIELSIFSD